jgi:hypothetical protein
VDNDDVERLEKRQRDEAQRVCEKAVNARKVVRTDVAVMDLPSFSYRCDQKCMSMMDNSASKCPPPKAGICHETLIHVQFRGGLISRNPKIIEGNILCANRTTSN